MITEKKRTINLYDLLLCCFAVWPFLWNVWGVLRFTASISVSAPIYILCGITIAMLFLSVRIKVSFLFSWFLFLGVIVAESMSRLGAIKMDWFVILCGAMICILMMQREADYKLILKYLYIVGLVVSVAVVLDNVFGLFKEGLIDLYTEESKAVKLRLAATGGILPHTASAGCFIYSGLAAYIGLTEEKGRKLNGINSLVTIGIFSLAALLIQKRGFILDVAIVIVLIRIFQLQREDLRTVKIQGQLRKTASVILIAILLVVVYNKVPLVHDSVDSLIDRFTSDDDTYSGRTELYSLAFSLYTGHELTGIGWGVFRLNTVGFFGRADVSYAVHNVYIQLLCETGIIGLISFLIPVIVSLLYAIKKYRRIAKNRIVSLEKTSVETGLFLQLFFLGYCMTGNPLYDYNFCITYFIGVLLTLIPIKDWES